MFFKSTSGRVLSILSFFLFRPCSHHIVYKFLFRFTKLYSMMWTYFLFDIYVEYEFKNFEHYFNVFWRKKLPFEKKTKESTAIVITKQCPKFEKLISFWVMMKYRFFIHWLIQILVVIVLDLHINLSSLELSKRMNNIKWIHKNYRSSNPQMFLGKGVLKISNKFAILKSHFGMGVLL